MKRILAYVHAYVGHGREAGAETTLANLLESLVEAGWEATVLLSQEYDNLRKPYYHNGVEVRPCRERDELNEIIPTYSAIITHLECSERSVFVAERAKVPVIQLIHNTLWQTEGYLAEGVDLAVYNSDWVAQHHTEARTSPVVSIPVKGAFSTHQISYRPRKTRTWDSAVVHPQIDPKQYAIEGPHDHITMVNMYENKGPEVFYEMARRFPNLNFMAVLGGYGKQVIDKSLPNVEFVANTKAIRDDVYRHTRVLLMPSDYETFGRVAIEAAASGIPTIANPTEGLVEALGEGGLFADRDNLDEWSATIQLLTDIPEYYARHSKYAKSRSDYWAAVKADETNKFIEKIESLVR